LAAAVSAALNRGVVVGELGAGADGVDEPDLDCSPLSAT